MKLNNQPGSHSAVRDCQQTLRLAATEIFGQMSSPIAKMGEAGKTSHTGKRTYALAVHDKVTKHLPMRAALRQWRSGVRDPAIPIGWFRQGYPTLNRTPALEGCVARTGQPRPSPSRCFRRRLANRQGVGFPQEPVALRRRRLVDRAERIRDQDEWAERTAAAIP